jgi:hypothetical protein
MTVDEYGLLFVDQVLYMGRPESEKYNGEVFNQIWKQVGGFKFPHSRRNQLVGAYVSIMLEHQRAVRALIDAGLVGSAFTLLRSQIEAGFRGLWVNLIGTDAQVEQIIVKDKQPFPPFRTLARLLDRSYNARGIFAHIAQHWKAFNSMTHSGMAQIGRRFDNEGNIAPNYRDEEIEEVLRFSASVSLLCVIPLFRCAKAPDRAEALEAWLEEDHAQQTSSKPKS